MTSIPLRMPLRYSNVWPTAPTQAVKWDIKPWRCDVLKQPALAALTVAVAANADLIVLALDRIPSPTDGTAETG